MYSEEERNIVQNIVSVKVQIFLIHENDLWNAGHIQIILVQISA